MTTTSGGNISARDRQGNLWITPAGLDKGSLTPDDIVCLAPDGTVIGPGTPSSEYPLHLAVSRVRPDIGAIIHAHPPVLTAFSIVGEVPDTTLMAGPAELCGTVGYAPYHLPGTAGLGERVADRFGSGHNAVIMENHAVVVAGRDLDEALARLEMLESCAVTIHAARSIGKVKRPAWRPRAEHRAEYETTATGLIQHDPAAGLNGEAALRELCRMAQRGYDRRLIYSYGGALSVRYGDGFLITPAGAPMHRLKWRDLLLISDMPEASHEDSREDWMQGYAGLQARLHAAVYRRHPSISSVITAQPPWLMAFAVTGVQPQARTIPESWLFLREMPLIPCGGDQHSREERQEQLPERIARELSEERPVVLMENHSVVTTGSSLLQAFDRLEVAEMTAMSLILSRPLGNIRLISDAEIEKLRDRFLRK